MVLESFCAASGWSYEIIEDLGSGLNYDKKGLKKLIRLISLGEIDRLVITHKDRLLRFGSELIFSLCEQCGIEVVILNKSENSSIENELVQDVLEIINIAVVVDFPRMNSLTFDYQDSVGKTPFL